MPDPNPQEREALAKGCREWEDRHTEAIPSTREFAEFLGEWMWTAALAAREEPQGQIDDLAHARSDAREAVRPQLLASENCAPTCYRDTDGIIAHSPECPAVHLRPAKPSPQDVLWRIVVERDELRDALAVLEEPHVCRHDGPDGAICELPPHDRLRLHLQRLERGYVEWE